MRVKYIALFFIIIALAWSTTPFVAHAEIVTMYSQPDASGEMISQQATFLNTWIASESIGNLILGKDRLTITFTIKDPNASNTRGQPAGVSLETCANCQDLQKYFFTNADRTLLSDGAFHTFTVQTGTTTRGTADGETPIYATFFNLSQYHNSTHLKSNADGTIPYLIIEGTPPTPPEVPQAPSDAVTVYTQSDKTGVMTNPQPTFLNAHIDSADLGNLNLGQGKLYITFTMKDPNADNTNHTPTGVAMGTCATCQDLQKYFFTDEDRTLLADQAFHTFMVETGTTTNSYADGTRSVFINFFNLSQYQYGTKIKSNSDGTIPYLIIKNLPPPDPCATPGACASNVLFLPGIEGSRLYEGTGCGKSAEEKLWEPYESLLKAIRGAGDDKVRNLFLNNAGESVCSDIYTKEGDILDSAGGDIYKSFISEMNGLKSDNTITDWKPIAYDWRLSLNDLLNKGTERDDKIYYAEATSTPYIEQTLRALAASSKTKKVTIVAHSNGGLVAKALLNQLGSSTSKSLVDKIVLVGAPQSGAPIDIGALMYGYDQGISSWGIPILHSGVARELAQNSPMAYHLLPSQNYFDSVASDANHPVARFAGDAYAKEISVYDTTIDNTTELYDFLRASSLNSSLIDYANVQHSVLDSWTPPDGIEVSQIAGWGADTVAGIDFYTASGVSALSSLTPVSMYKPIFTEDGDGTVPVSSALMMASSTNMKKYWVNLDSYRKSTSIKRSHKDIFEVPSLQDFIKNIIKNSTSTLPAYISTNQPPPTSDKKLFFFLHSPLTLQLTDSSGNVTGLAEDNSMTQDIPDSSYGEFGDVKYITVPQGNNYELTMHGQDSGSFALEIQESSGGVIANSSIITNVPTTASTFASLTISDGISTASALIVDENGDGTKIIEITPKIGETVNYVPSATPPAQETSSGQGGAYITPSISTESTQEIEIPMATASEQIVPSASDITTSTPAIITVQAEKKTPISVTPSKKVNKNIPQTASVYSASQQPFLKMAGIRMYTGFYRMWIMLKKLF